MEPNEFVKLIITLVFAGMIGGFFTLIGKIVLEWLRAKANPQKGGNSQFSRNRCDNIHKDLSDWRGTTDTSIALLTKISDDHEKRLDKGSTDFKDIRDSIAGLDTSYKVLATKIK